MKSYEWSDLLDLEDVSIAVRVEVEGWSEEPKLHGHPDNRHDGGGEHQTRVVAFLLQRDGETLAEVARGADGFDILEGAFYDVVDRLARKDERSE